MKILVTGGAGFIGSHLCDSLVQQGHEVSVIDNLVLGRIENIQHLMRLPGFRFHQGDILDDSFLSDLFKRGSFDEVYHLAANSDIQKGHDDPNVDLNLTFLTTFQVLQCMRRYGVDRLVFTSSSAIYGEVGGMVSEDTGPLIPVSLYGAAKLGSEAYISAFVENFNMRGWIIRFPNVVGERATHGVVFDFINRLRDNPNVLEILGDGNQNKPYLYVLDLIQGILFIRRNSNQRLNVYNIGSNDQTTVRKIAEIVCQEMGLRPSIVYSGGARGWVGDVPEYRYDLEKIRKLGWQASFGSDESIRIAVRKILSGSGNS